MSLLDANIDVFEINLYYKFVEVSSGKKLIILKDEEAEEQSKSGQQLKSGEQLKAEKQIKMRSGGLKEGEQEEKKEEKKEEVVIERLVTQWRFLNWREQNEVMTMASKTINPVTSERQFNFITYRDAIIKRCLKSWDMTIDDQPVPVTSENIDKLPGPVVMALYQKFEKIIDYTEEEVKN